jgi:serine/threonine-protein kinase
MHQVMHAKVGPPSELVEGLDPAWDAIVLRGLERDEERRYATAREMALEIETRLQLARATEVGTWVESLAIESLAKRAAEVTSVESASDVDVVPAEPTSVASKPASGSRPVPPKSTELAKPRIPDAPPLSTESTASRISAVSWPLHAAPKRQRRARLAVAVAAAAVGAAAVVVWVVVATRAAPHPGELPGAAAIETSSMPEPAPSPGVASASPVPTPEASSIGTTPTPTPESVSSSSPAPVRPPRAPRAKPSAPSPVTKAPSLGGVLDTRR